MKNNQGQSLIELVTVVAIFSLISFSVLSFFSFATNTYHNVMRHEKMMYEYRLLSYYVESTVKNSNSYEIEEDKVLFDDVVFGYASAKQVTDYVTNFASSISEELITVTFSIKVYDKSETYEMKILLPPKNE